MNTKPLQGQHYTFGERAHYEIYEAEPDFLPRIEKVLKAFGFRRRGRTLRGFDSEETTVSNAGVELRFGWDNWSGCYLFAVSPEGDAHVLRIGQHLDALLDS